jgi:hypothetical protein
LRARRPSPGLPHRRQPPPVKPPGRALVWRTFLTGAVPDSYTFNGHVIKMYHWRLLQSNRGPAIHAPNMGTLDRPASHPFCGPASGRRFAPVRLAFESPPFGGSAAGPPVASKPRDTPCRLTPKRQTLGVQKNDRVVEPAVGHPLRPPVAWVGWAPFPPRAGEPYRRPMGLRLGPANGARSQPDRSGEPPRGVGSRILGRRATILDPDPVRLGRSAAGAERQAAAA